MLAGYLAIALSGWSSPPLSASGDWPEPVEDSMPFGKLMVDRLEYAWRDDRDAVVWDIQGWYGGDYRRLWVKTEGADASGANGGEAEIELLYSRLVAPFWDLQLGAGYQRVYGPGPDRQRSFLIAGFQGLAPYWFEVDVAVRLSDDGDLSVHAEAEYDLWITQRLIIQPRVETQIAAQAVPEFDTGGGVTAIGIGVRLRYEIRREFAPYVGVSWDRRFGETGDIARRAGEDVEEFSAVAGARLWF